MKVLIVGAVILTVLLIIILLAFGVDGLALLGHGNDST